MAPATIQELTKLLADDTKVQVCAVDADGVLRGKIMAKDKFLSAAVDGFGFCSVVMGWDMHDQAYAKELKISNLANGYRDLIARIDLDTYRRTPTTPSLPFFLVTFIEPTTNETLCACPRGLLQRINDQIEAEGYSAYAGAEYEYFQFRETPVSVAAKDFKNLEPLTCGMHGYSMLRPELNSEYFHDIWDNCAKFGIPIEGHHTETGPGVFESALAYQPALRMADNATLFKWVAKTTGLKYGIMPTFMAKPYADQPGCSGHVHISLRDKSGKNVFAVEESELKDGRADAKFEDTKRISKTAEHFLAGVLLGLPDIMPLLVPTVNGYKRLVESFWAPTRVMYAYENRIASVRIISPPLASPSATRLEIRVPGADMNPHLTFSAILALGLHGIREKLELRIPPINTSKGGAASIQSFARLPSSLASATENMKATDSMARKVLGDDFVDHFAGTRENETDLFNATVTDWELKRYFELA
ncbi:glutamine synthetase [Microbotryum lychnidis-dioicae p1A1 Lamole]|uniref:Glutamine synthetase n=1 Tax=Microbotryum lychnidis-dioicae (strain p1A1 Lamole / MvSl-1064) TaxID=683840 RepID=U5HHS5_USTV1|nr:glutamine synthetase [Microbotryum lychnidis-dioicae p1A1 Lamole]|eukprot:KDE02882.1 glutamine synthetase [Microbotryum lychnidis-dioicae p1A1 Lamole]